MNRRRARKARGSRGAQLPLPALEREGPRPAERAEPVGRWCSAACWLARDAECHCSCRGANHGRGRRILGQLI